MSVDEAIAFCKLNDHQMPGEVSVVGTLTREAMRTLWREVERLRAQLACLTAGG